MTEDDREVLRNNSKKTKYRIKKTRREVNE